MLLIIDTSAASDSTNFDQLTQLDGREYLMRFLWSGLESCWYLDLSDQDGNPLALGIKLTVGWPLLRRFHDTRLPPGLFMVGDTSGTLRDIETPDDILPDGRCPLLYITTDDEFFA